MQYLIGKRRYSGGMNMKKIVFYVTAGIAFVLFVVFFIWARVEKKEWIIFVFLVAAIAVFLACGFIITKIDDKKRKRPSDYIDEKMGEFWDDGFGSLSQETTWCDHNITLCIDGGDEKEIEDSMKHAFSHFQNPAKSDKIICEHVADDLIGLANDWNNDSIDRDEFIKRISLIQINIKSKGDYEFWLDSDGIFTDHSIVVYGNMVSGFHSTDIVG